MDTHLKFPAEPLASPAQTQDDLNGLFRSLMAPALESLLDTEEAGEDAYYRRESGLEPRRQRV